MEKCMAGLGRYVVRPFHYGTGRAREERVGQQGVASDMQLRQVLGLTTVFRREKLMRAVLILQNIAEKVKEAGLCYSKTSCQ